jgi:predicted nucleic acid-binding protein
MNAVDTNVLIYVHDPRDPRKQSIATELVREITNCALLWQVACEYVAASRKLQAFGFGPQDAWNDLRRLHTLWQSVLPNWTHHLKCESLMQGHSLSFWDALLLATAIEEGIGTLYSEDLASVGQIPGIKIINPFIDQD